MRELLFFRWQLSFHYCELFLIGRLIIGHARMYASGLFIRPGFFISEGLNVKPNRRCNVGHCLFARIPLANDSALQANCIGDIAVFMFFDYVFK